MSGFFGEPGMVRSTMTGAPKITVSKGHTLIWLFDLYQGVDYHSI